VEFFIRESGGTIVPRHEELGPALWPLRSRPGKPAVPRGGAA
jgi:hypothetical protein